MEEVKEELLTANMYPVLEKDLPPELLEAFNRTKTVEDELALLKKGTILWKVRSFSSWYRRLYYLDDVDGTLRYDPSHKPGCYTPTTEMEVIDILDVRQGWKTDTFNKIGRKVEKKLRKSPNNPPAVDEACCFSVIHGPAKHSLDLVAPSPPVAAMWVRGLNHIIKIFKEVQREQLFDRWLQQQFEDADVDRNGSLSFEECCKLLLQLNVSVTKKEAEKLFNDANTNRHLRDGEQVLDATEFLTFFNNLISRPEVMSIYEKYSLSKTEMSAEGLCKFLRTEQSLPMTTIQDCNRLIESFEQSAMKRACTISPMGFTHLLMSREFDIFKLEHRSVYQDMTLALSHYYIASSHNTYLTGGQLSGESSVEGYIDALKRGCRCVEMDCWDGPDGEPIVYHGYTLTTKILFHDVIIDAIKPYAFKTSEYPVIISIENHCSEKQQETMAKHLQEILGDMLYISPVSDDMEYLPSPEELRMKVIVKAKKLHPPEKHNEDFELSSDEEDGHSLKESKKAVAEGLSNLVNVCESVHFRGFEESKTKGKCYQISSFSESKALKLIETNLEDFIEFNKKQLSRIYPSGTRTSSSNFKPTPFWNAGCQIVALNYQSSRKPIFINEAKFHQNGSCGYVLKPECYRQVGSNDLKAPVKNSAKVLKLKILSGQYIPKCERADERDVVDPYVKVRVLGHPDDTQGQKTAVIKDNGFNPQWNHEMVFVVKEPEMAMVWFTVKDESVSGINGTLGVFALPFTSLNEGYRHVHLMDYTRKPVSPASLFVHVSITNYNPATYKPVSRSSMV